MNKQILGTGSIWIIFTLLHVSTSSSTQYVNFCGIDCAKCTQHNKLRKVRSRQVALARNNLSLTLRLLYQRTQLTSCCFRFFSDMEDLRRKLQDGTLTRSSGMGPKPTLMERLFPPFLSPRLLEDSTKKDKDKSAYYEPPLLPIDCQNPASNFFAGQKSKFKAQTPLPLNSAYQKAIDSRRTSGNPSRCTSRVNSHGSRHNSTAALARQPSRTSRENTLMRHMLQRQSNSRTKLW